MDNIRSARVSFVCHWHRICSELVKQKIAWFERICSCRRLKTVHIAFALLICGLQRLIHLLFDFLFRLVEWLFSWRLSDRFLREIPQILILFTQRRLNSLIFYKVLLEIFSSTLSCFDRVWCQILTDKFGRKRVLHWWKKLVILNAIYSWFPTKFAHNWTWWPMVVKSSTSTYWTTQQTRFPGGSIYDSIVESIFHEVSFFFAPRHTMVKHVSCKFFTRW